MLPILVPLLAGAASGVARGLTDAFTEGDGESRPQQQQEPTLVRETNPVFNQK
ncbi:hypothetical protein AB0A69_07535 [Streptomyces sp. NPDC045431]|uniref:hypothetical protein n=1 Tax=Streptomyces sp. NPDC045431 TaxID=3155613 RepID=UPI00340BE17F